MVRAVSAYLQAIRSTAELRWYERIFSVWHAFHLPLFFILLAAATIHVIAVHMY